MDYIVKYCDVAKVYILLLHLRSGYVPSLAKLVEILAVRHVKQGMETKGFRALQSLVQLLH